MAEIDVVLCTRAELIALADDPTRCTDVLLRASNDRFSAWEINGGEGPGDLYLVLRDRKCDLPYDELFVVLWSRAFILIEEWDVRFCNDAALYMKYACSGDYLFQEFKKFVQAGPLLQTCNPGTVKDAFHEKIKMLSNLGGSKARPYNGKAVVRERGKPFAGCRFEDGRMDAIFTSGLLLTDEWNHRSWMFQTAEVDGYFSWSISA